MRVSILMGLEGHREVIRSSPTLGQAFCRCLWANWGPGSNSISCWTLNPRGKNPGHTGLIGVPTGGAVVPTSWPGPSAPPASGKRPEALNQVGWRGLEEARVQWRLAGASRPALVPALGPDQRFCSSPDDPPDLCPRAHTHGGPSPTPRCLLALPYGGRVPSGQSGRQCGRLAHLPSEVVFSHCTFSRCGILPARPPQAAAGSSGNRGMGPYRLLFPCHP